MDQRVAESPCELMLGRKVKGVRKAQGEWTITDKVERRPDSSGGTFSVGYLATHSDGTLAFVKATDIGLLSGRRDHSGALELIVKASSEQSFERQILDVCRGNNMDRVIHAIDYGEYETDETGVKEFVFFIMFEPAKGDVRSQVNLEKKNNLSWCTQALHNLSVAVQQLHNARIAHNDIKPSNLLIFDDYLQKLADLGRATSDTHMGPWDGLNYAGDLAYAAPEFLYKGVEFPNTSGKISFEVRRASDLYHLGSMGFFLVTGVSLTPSINRFLQPPHWHNNWTGTFSEVVPYLQSALSNALLFFENELPKARGQ